MEKELLYDGYLKIHKVEGKTKNGTQISREVMSRASDNRTDDSVAGLIFNPENNKFYLTRQFRTGSMDYMTEIVAGTLEVNEDPKECFKRESIEEVGVEIDKIEYLGEFYVSPGGTSEKIFLYYAEGKEISQGGGLDSEMKKLKL